ncbi:MAG: hypothetical protein RLZ32_807 [Gemmatimonadota bacterium]|jgi:hypothetical protein
MRLLALTFALLLQPQQDIGTITGGHPVRLDPTSLRTAQGITTATVRVRFLTPVKVPGGTWGASRTIVMVDCARQAVAVKENWYYRDAAGKQVAQHRVVAQPGFGPPLPGSVGAVTMRHLCTTAPR